MLGFASVFVVHVVVVARLNGGIGGSVFWSYTIAYPMYHMQLAALQVCRHYTQAFFLGPQGTGNETMKREVPMSRLHRLHVGN